MIAIAGSCVESFEEIDEGVVMVVVVVVVVVVVFVVDVSSGASALGADSRCASIFRFSSICLNSFLDTMILEYLSGVGSSSY